MRDAATIHKLFTLPDPVVEGRAEGDPPRSHTLLHQLQTSVPSLLQTTRAYDRDHAHPLVQERQVLPPIKLAARSRGVGIVRLSLQLPLQEAGSQEEPLPHHALQLTPKSSSTSTNTPEAGMNLLLDQKNTDLARATANTSRVIAGRVMETTGRNRWSTEGMTMSTGGRTMSTGGRRLGVNKVRRFQSGDRFSRLRRWSQNGRIKTSR